MDSEPQNFHSMETLKQLNQILNDTVSIDVKVKKKKATSCSFKL